MLLWFLARRMEWLAKTHPEFIAKLHGRNFTLQFSSGDGTQRFFRIHHGRVVSRNAAHAAPSLTVHFTSDDAAFSLLTKADKNAFMGAVQNGEVKVTGDLSLLLWFMGIIPYLRPGRRKAHAGEAAT